MSKPPSRATGRKPARKKAESTAEVVSKAEPAPGPAPTLRLSERKRLSIIEAAKDEFLQRGFPATSMDQIARRAQVSKRTVYNHFASKEALFSTIVKETFTWFEESLALPYNPKAAIDKELSKLAQKEVDLLLSEHFKGAMRLALAECIRSPALAQQTFASIEERENGMVVWMRAAAEDGRLAISDPRLAANQFSSLLKGELFWPQIIASLPPPSRRDCQRVIKSTVELFIAHYGVGKS